MSIIVRDCSFRSIMWTYLILRVPLRNFGLFGVFPKIKGYLQAVYLFTISDVLNCNTCSVAAAQTPMAFMLVRTLSYLCVLCVCRRVSITPSTKKGQRFHLVDEMWKDETNRPMPYSQCLYHSSCAILASQI